MSEAIAVALVSGLCVAIPSVIGTVLSNKKNKDIVEYRIQELTKRVEKHNNVIERVYKLETKVEDIEKKVI